MRWNNLGRLLTSMLILIIASTNNSIMWLSRHLLEFRHLTLRITLGASRGLLIRSLVLESVVLAIVGATLGLAFNRLADIHYDRLNPRTRERALPKGTLSVRFASVFTVAMSGLFVVAAWEQELSAMRPR